MAGYVTSLRNSRLNAIVSACGATGRLLIYSGTRPATGAAPSGTLLVTMPLKNPVGTVAAAVLTFTKPDDVQATANGTASWARIDDGTNAVIDLSLSDTTGVGEVKLNTTTITTGLFVSAQTITVNEGNP